ncbi:MAG: Hsp20/alpha crystallin family protein [Victivallales bacterium]|nr:Hsp20/alpha crystallin family protein [Victivallales bacterium]
MLALTRNSNSLSPWRSFADLHREFFNAFRDFEEHEFGRNYPSTRIDADEEKISMQTCLPGFTPEEIDIQYMNDCVTISAEHNEEKDQKDDKKVRFERHSGSYKETYRLGAKIDFDKAKATYKNGVLYLDLPKAESEKPRRIAIGK